MENITINDLLNLVKTYNPREVKKVRSAYEYAALMHEGQFRQSGEPYITHPLNVAYILAELHADGATLCAGLLHDTIEDTKATKEDIIANFGEEIANLVDGVTKFPKQKNYSKADLQSANFRKIINGLTQDVRIIIIKLADRLHNMRTLGFKKDPSKQRNIARETFEVFVPLAHNLGINKIQGELEDLSLMYLQTDDYKKSSDLRQKIVENYTPLLEDMLSKIRTMLADQNIPSEIKIRIKNIYGVYLRKVKKKVDSHDLLALKVMVDEVEQCYLALGLIHSKWPMVNGTFRDYIGMPKTNLYSGLHTTLITGRPELVQAQIRTHEMDFIASNGLPAYWALKKGRGAKTMQAALNNTGMVDTISVIDGTARDDRSFEEAIKAAVLPEKIFVYTKDGEKIFLPKRSTVIDFAYKIHTDVGNKMVGAMVNDEERSIYSVLENGDCVDIITTEQEPSIFDFWKLFFAQTGHAQREMTRGLKK